MSKYNFLSLVVGRCSTTLATLPMFLLSYFSDRVWHLGPALDYDPPTHAFHVGGNVTF
jgi:hypothetical protein